MRRPDTFHNERSLSDPSERRLTAWTAGGALSGDPKDLPAPPAFSDGWSLGTPDLVLTMDEDFAIPANGAIEYEHFYIPTNFSDEKWVTSLEVAAWQSATRASCARLLRGKDRPEERRL